MTQATRQAEQPATRRELIRIRGLTKRFGNTLAVDSVDLDIYPGEVLALMGANGAGKSTLIKMLCGVNSITSGTVEIDGQPVAFTSPQDACAAGIRTVHQLIDDGVVQELTVAENLVLDEICSPGGPLLLGCDRIRARAREIQAILGLDLPLNKPTGDLGQAERQLIAIARALSHEPKLLILDEPTSSLSDSEASRLFDIVEDLRARGVSIIYISHRMSDIHRLADRAVVMRDGRYRAEFFKPLDFEAMINAMVGHKLDLSSRKAVTGGRPVVSFDSVVLRGNALPFDLQLCEGEVVVLTGLIGAGKSELAECLFGLRTPLSGTITLDGETFNPKTPGDAIAKGVFMAPEDRGNSSLIVDFSVRRNMTLPFLKRYSQASLVQGDREKAASDQQIKDLRIKCESSDAPILSLSGGNQQKVVLGRWLLQPSRLLILDEPFQGVDIGARQDIGRRIRETARGRATLVICADLEEATEIADRVIVMRDYAAVGSHSIDGLSHDALIAEMSAVRSETALRASSTSAH